MKDFPHHYKATSEGTNTGNLTARADNLPDIEVAPPKQFDGPGDAWSPEQLFMASLTNCLVLSFRAIARASKLEWHSIECESEGTLAKVEKKVQFTNVISRVKLFIPATESKEKAGKLLTKAEETCFISNSINCESHLECEVKFGEVKD